MDLPIIFIHRYSSSYLKQTLAAARLSNPRKHIVLLGDPTNRWIERLGIEHVDMDGIASSPERDTFRRVFQVVAGREHGRADWVQFVFDRWFIIYAYARRNGFERFWTFDSDTMILQNLFQFEEGFAELDCTEQCHGACMNGYIGSLTTVQAYLDHINTLFQDGSYLEARRRDFLVAPQNAFTEMGAYLDFKRTRQPRTLHLGIIRDGAFFDDCISRPDGMETRLCEGRTVKAVYRVGSCFYCRQLSSGDLVRVNTLNMSWAPEFLFLNVLNALKDSRYAAAGDSLSRLLPLRPPVGFTLRRGLRSIARRLRASVYAPRSGGRF
jgi:hypothetical protein